MSSAAPVPIERLSAELRTLRMRLIRYEQRQREAWTVDLEAYDRRLVDAAVMVEVAVSGGAPALPLSPDTRAAIEEGLAAAGLEVRTEVL